ncbi:hypothetical protein KFZ76_04100 [Methylovulum psychrotolerans]|uniref:hypothetical protein n=1 Tax=Methylovulum psychrotolerans TaxID=1704499 RepID=UPI001BFFA5AA|nr:hypothetical protein [Methylovulum psychrotolerans]MBT9096894.1 hypothetical protein [Methylovulum psychrotolerans]
MPTTPRPALAITLLIIATSCQVKAPNTYSFALWGDMPYTRNGDGAKDGEKMTRLLASMNAAHLAFTVYDGDTKDGASLCTDSAIGLEVKTLFNKLQAPTIYVPGDNEWTDCHRRNNGGYNALERLNYLRKTLFAEAFSFGQNKIPLQRQGAAGGLYAENVRWQQGGVIFVGLNMPGSNNNKVHDGHCLNPKSARTEADCAADNAEYRARDAANIAFLRASFTIARQQQAVGLMVIIQADPGFDLPETDTENERQKAGFDGYDAFLATLIAEIKAFNGQVVLTHGDTHFYKVDKPLADSAHLLKNLTRVETFGSPNLHWVQVQVDTSNPNVFSFQPMMVDGN